MESNFDIMFDSSDLPHVLNLAKTLSKEECRLIYKYIVRKSPSVIFEFGTQHGCSTLAFLRMTQWAQLKTQIHSWDIKDVVKFIPKSSFVFHKDNVIGRESNEFDKYNPSLVFLDAHPYSLTDNIINICLQRKIDFMCHDVTINIGWDSVRDNTNNFTSDFNDLSKNVPWELYLLVKKFGRELLTKDKFEDDSVNINFCRDRYGIVIVEPK